jgi:uncharacterized membrane protein
MQANQTRQIIGLALVVLSAMLSFALIPQSTFSLPPLVTFFLGILNVGVTTACLYLNVRMPGQAGGAG